MNVGPKKENWNRTSEIASTAVFNLQGLMMRINGICTTFIQTLRMAVFPALTAGKYTNIEATCVGIWYTSVENKLSSNVHFAIESFINNPI